MPQKTNLNISPYYDDFDKADNFYKVLFKPGHPVQARELTGLQSILQNQLESFGSHIFKEGSMVIPGSVTYDSTYFSAKVNPDHLGIDITVYLDALINNNNGKGTRVKGQNSQIVGTIKNYILPPNDGIDDITIFIKYTESGSTGESTSFPNAEILLLEENVTYGNTTLVAGETVLTLSTEDATSIGSAVGVDNGVYFVRGTFVDVEKSLIVLEPYSNKPSYRVGFDVIEEVVNANDDPSLNDNAKGFTNYAAPGADRFRIRVKLAKKSLLDFNDTNFVELIRIRKGEIKKLQDTSVYSEIKKYFAKRTYEESGNYAVKPFRVNIQNSLNNEIDSAGLYLDTEKTDEGNDPSEDTMCVKLSPGTAYVRGFDVNLPGTTVLDIDKPRDTKTIKSSSVGFQMGSLLKINNIDGFPYINIGDPVGSGENVVSLHNERRLSSSNPAQGPGVKVGQARVYWFGLADAPYTGSSTVWDLYLFDVQTYTYLQISNPGTIATQIPLHSRVRGVSSGAVGYVSGHNPSELILSQTTGTFVQGESLKINEQNTSSQSTVITAKSYTVDDIKSVHQKSSTLNNQLAVNFNADAVLYDKILPNFSGFDQLTIEGVDSSTSKATCPRRRFSGKVGISTGAIVGFSTGLASDDTYNIVDAISSDGSELTLKPVEVVEGVCGGKPQYLPAGITTTSTFRIKRPAIINLNKSGLYTKLPKKNISAVDTSDSNVIISKQVTGKLTSSSGTLELSTSDVLDVSTGISSAFFEPYDDEKYSLMYATGAIEKLSSNQVNVKNNGNDIEFIGLNNSTAVILNTTLKKIGLTSKSKDYVRSSQLEVSKTVGVSTNGGLVQNKYYGLRVEDDNISLNVPDVVKIHAVYESKNTVAPTLDKLTFVSGLSLNENSIVGEKIVGNDSRAIGQIVNRVDGENIEFVYLNGNTFTVGETINFKESNIESVLQTYTAGNYIDKTSNYSLDKGHKKQYSDYSRLVRKNNGSVPSKRLLVIFDYYKVASGNNGDLFTVNSYTKERYTSDIPAIGRDRASDILDFRPRVRPFDSSTTTDRSPFAFESRSFETNTKYSITPNESSILGYTYYLPRIDKLVINKFEQVKLIKGVSADKPAPPTEIGDSMEVAQISLPPYLYNPITDPNIKLFDNRRFTMRDIGKLEKRIDNLEIMTSLTALELDTKSLQVTDADGIDRFKSGFVVNDFKDRSFIDFNATGKRTEDGSRCDVDVVNKELISAVDMWSIPAELALMPSLDERIVDTSANYKLLDENCQKTGDLLTLAYSEVDWIKNTQASNVENINPFNVIVYVGGIILDPASDNWIRTIYVDNWRKESTGATWVESSNVESDTTASKTDVDVTSVEVEPDDSRDWIGNHVDTTTTKTTTTTRTIETSFTNTLEGPSKEFDYVESIKISGATDPFMRSRNVGFNANGLKAFTKHYHKLDSGIPDIFPKLIEIEMQSGSFTIGENAKIMKNGVQIGYVRVKAPEHKIGESWESVPLIRYNAGLTETTGDQPGGSAMALPPEISSGRKVEKYSVDPFDRTRPAPSVSYSATSKLFNIDIVALANSPSYYGYVVDGANIVGEQSGANATVTDVSLYSDNWGDVLGTFFFRDANQSPMPHNLFYTGTKTFRITATPPGTVTLPGSTAYASDASGTYTGTGSILTQATSTVGVRVPPAPTQKPNSITHQVSVNQESDTVRVEAPYRDPLAQSFAVDESGAFLTSFDVYFASKDPNARVFVELRDVELGTPTSFLVQDYAQVALSPDDIQVSDDASIATNIRFPSPVYLEAGKEYAIVFLSPSSDLYEMWVSTMGQKTIRTANLPDVESAIVTKQYIGGSLFKSQNGTIWTPSQYQDLTFTLYKASFVPSGTVTFYNSPIEPGNENTQTLSNNPIRTHPRKLKVSLSGTAASATLPIGRKVSTGAIADPEDSSVTGIIERIGSGLDTNASPAESELEIIARGNDYAFTNTNLIPLKAVTGNGSGATVSVSITNGIIDANGLTNITSGTGYVVGDILTIDNSSALVTSGYGARFAVAKINSALDTLYLTDVQGQEFTNGDQLIHYGASNDTRTEVAGTTIGSNGSQVLSDINTGNVLEITQPNHAHHGINNVVKIQNIKPDSILTQTSLEITESSTSVSVADTSCFVQFAGIVTDRGQALIGQEIVEYVLDHQNKLALSSRGLEDSTASVHAKGSTIQPYQINGFPLVGINSTINLPSNTTLRNASNIDNYFLEIDRGTSSRSSGKTMLCFTDEKGVGGNSVKVSQNHQFSSLSPKFNVITPGNGTRASASIRTVSGTSAGGNEISFIDQGFEPTILNETTFFPTPRLCCSKTNESERLTNLPKHKSVTLKVDMTSTDKNLSPVLDIKNAMFELGRNKINNPIGVDNYDTDSRTNAVLDDPHGSMFISKRVNLAQPATSIRVLVAANVRSEADIRVFYRLYSADSTEVSQSYRPFPGYTNLIDLDGDGFGDEIIDSSKNDGRADAKVESNNIDGFSEYQFTVNDLEQFSGFNIKIVMTSTNESVPVRLKDFRAIALA